MKGVLVFIGGLLIGAAIMYATKPDRTAELATARQEGEVTARRLADTQGALARQESKAVALRKELETAKLAAAAPPPAAPVTAAPKESEAAPLSDEGAKKFAQMIRTVGHGQYKAQMEAKLAQLKERLKLTPAQEERLKTLAAESSDQMLKALDRLFEGKGEAGDFGALVKMQLGGLPDDIVSDLTPEQKVEYARFREEERANRIEMRANAELIGLQATGGLTPEQKDLAFSKLSEFAAQEEDVNWASITTADSVQTYFEDAVGKRVGSLKDVLNESQMQIYQQQIEMQRQMISNLIPGLKKKPDSTSR